MLAEDHYLNVEVARRILEKEGVSVEVANNGIEAMETFAEAEQGTFDAILMDVQMPEMDWPDSALQYPKNEKAGKQDDTNHRHDGKCI